MIFSANLRAFLHMIRVGEGTADPDGYRRHFGGSLFDSFADHPRRVITAGMGKKKYSSSAAGAYQFLTSTWQECKEALNLPDFSPESQDKAAVYLIKRRGALEDVEAGRFEQAVRKCSREWASLPGSPYGQPTKTMAQALETYKQAGGSLDEPRTQSENERTQTGNVVDPINAPQGEAMDPVSLFGLALPTLIKAAPDLIRVFSDSPNGERNAKAAEVVKQIAEESTSSANLQEAAEQIASSPEQAKAFRDAVQENWFEIESAMEKSRAAAREFNNAREQMKGVRTVVGRFTFIEFLTLILIAFCFVGGGALLYWGKISTATQDNIVMLMVVATLIGVREYWYGSSHGSRMKDEQK